MRKSFDIQMSSLEMNEKEKDKFCSENINMENEKCGSLMKIHTSPFWLEYGQAPNMSLSMKITTMNSGAFVGSTLSKYFDLEPLSFDYSGQMGVHDFRLPIIIPNSLPEDIITIDTRRRRLSEFSDNRRFLAAVHQEAL